MNIELVLTLPNNFWSWQTALFFVMFFVYGSIPFAYIFTYLLSRKKIDETGTGNISVGNAFGVGGLTAGLLTVAGEASKGVFPVMVSQIMYDNALITSIIFITVGILGYGNSFFLKGKGGQGGTILMWALLLLSPYTLLIYLFLTIAIYVLIRRRRLAMTLGYIFLPVEILIIEQNLAFMIFGALLACYYILRYNPLQSDYGYYKSKMRFLSFIEKTFKEKPSFVLPFSGIKSPSEAGFKAYSLKLLKKAGANVPNAYVCPFTVFQDYRKHGDEVLKALKGELSKIIKEYTSYSVRSSASREDGVTHSFAGQFMSYLNISNIEDMVTAIVNVWQSIESDRVQAYLKHTGKSSEELQMAVIIQEMVKARFSGVVFTRNPVTGFDEIVVEAVSGFGDRLYRQDALMERWVYKWGNWLEKPANTTIDEEVIVKIITESRKISQRYGSAVDLEWAYDGNKIYWLQLRLITSLKGVNIYSNKISKEFLPGMIKPLVWSINIPVVNSSWKKLLLEIIGNDAANIDIHNLAKSIYYRAYFNMGIMGDIFELLGMPRELLELLIGLEIEREHGPRFRPGLTSVKYIPRVLFFFIKLIIFKKDIRRFIKNYTTRFNDISRQIGSLKDENEIINAIEELIKATTDASYFVIVTMLLMSLYNTLLKSQEKRHGLAIKYQKLQKLKASLLDINPNHRLVQLNSLYKDLSDNDKERFRRGDLPVANDTVTLQKLHVETAGFLEIFGHLSESGNDFSRPQWKENPRLVRNMIAEFADIEDLEQELIDHNIKETLPGNPFFRFVFTNAVAFQELREQVNNLYTYGYGLFRHHFLSIGSLWQQKNYIDTIDDIFYVSYDEIKNFLSQMLSPYELREIIKHRKNEMQRFQDLRLPSVIVGDTMPPEVSTYEVNSILRGIPASRGNYTGIISVVPTLEDFQKIHKDSILVIPHSDVGWTPLFISAKGIISESGGMLSHCAIIAREYGIPTVVSVPDAMSLRDGMIVTLDGDKGEVLLRD
jgi:glycerol-3-phosphate acyltransferase PlsY/phosphohistidine swiveling domain-containing protein